MNLLLKKSMEDLMSLSMQRLQASPINEVGRGGVVRLILSIINENIEGFYEALEVNHARALLSTAEGSDIDVIGYMLSCKRNNGEADNDYKLRISEQVLSMAAANETAIRLAILSVPEVQDLVMKKFTMGTGSFSAFIVTSNAIPDPSILEKVRSNVEAVVGYGIKFDVSGSGLVYVEAKAKLMFKADTDLATQQTCKAKAQQALKDYFNSRSIGESIIIDEITQRIMEVNDVILKYQLYELKINSKNVLNKDQDCKWNERFVESAKPNSILVS